MCNLTDYPNAIYTGLNEPYHRRALFNVGSGIQTGQGGIVPTVCNSNKGRYFTVGNRHFVLLLICKLLGWKLITCKDQ